MHTLNILIGNFVGFIWNWPVTLLCLLGCIFFTIFLKLIQLRCFPHAIELIKGKFDNPNEKGQITHFQALSAALSATIGLGNIAGVAIAIAIAGPGSIFWMWVIGFFGMATKYVECTLGTHYREFDKETNEVHGGPMYYITKGLGKKFKPLAIFYAVAISLSAFGAGCLFQANQAAAALNQYYHIPTLYTGIGLFLVSFIVIIGGIKRIGNVASKIVPLMCVIYICCALLICLLNAHHLPAAFAIIFKDAFSGYAIAGGFVPVLFAGIRRAIFSNEAGLGSAAIAHAAVKTDYPVREGIVASLGPFIDTIVVCTATAMIIILSGHYGPHMYQNMNNSIINFENQESQDLRTENWSIAKINSAPQTTDPFRRFTDGTHVLEHTPSQQSSSPIKLKSISNETEYIRFSYFNKTGDMKVNIYNNNTLLASFDSNSEKSSTAASIQFFSTQNDWQSAVIHIKDPAMQDISLEFVPLSTNTHWFIDSVQPVKKLSGIALTTYSFDSFIDGFGSIFITFSVLFFAFSTMITWSYYGETALHYLFGNKVTTLYRWIFVSLMIVGATQSLDLIINFSDAMIGLLVIPNMIALILLSKNVKQWTIEYFQKLKDGTIKPFSS